MDALNSRERFIDYTPEIHAEHVGDSTLQVRAARSEHTDKQNVSQVIMRSVLPENFRFELRANEKDKIN